MLCTPGASVAEAERIAATAASAAGLENAAYVNDGGGDLLATGTVRRQKALPPGRAMSDPRLEQYSLGDEHRTRA